MCPLFVIRTFVIKATGNKTVQFAREYKDWTLEQWKKKSCGLTSPDLPYSSATGASG